MMKARISLIVLVLIAALLGATLSGCGIQMTSDPAAVNTDCCG